MWTLLAKNRDCFEVKLGRTGEAEIRALLDVVAVCGLHKGCQETSLVIVVQVARGGQKSASLDDKHPDSATEPESCCLIHALQLSW